MIWSLFIFVYAPDFYNFAKHVLQKRRVLHNRQIIAWPEGDIFSTFYITMICERIRQDNISTYFCRNRAYNVQWLLYFLTNYCNLIFFEQFSRVVHRNLLQIYKKQS